MKKFFTFLLLLTFIQSPAVAYAPLVGMPPVLDPSDIYSADRANQLSLAVAGMRELVYVPNHTSNTVSVIDPKTFKIIKTFKTAKGPQHIVPSYDLKTLWVDNNSGNFITPIDPMSVTIGKPIPVHDPYNLYFTPDGKFAVVMQESDKQITFRNPHTLKLINTLGVPCRGVNHADWSADGNTFVVSCEFTGQLLLIDTAKQKLLKKVLLPTTYSKNPMPQDVKISPDGKTFYIADMMSNGIWVMPANNFGSFTFIKTGKEAHGLLSLIHI